MSMTSVSKDHSDVIQHHQLFYVIWGRPIHSISRLCLPIENSNALAIKKLLSSKLSLIDEKIDLYLFDREVSEQMDYLEDMVKLDELQPIWPLQQLSNIFSLPLNPMHVHIVVEVLDRDWTKQNAVDNIELNCWVSGDKLEHYFTVKISKRETVSDLKEVIKKAKPSYFQRVELGNIHLHDVSIPAVDKKKLGDQVLPFVPQKPHLDPMQRLSRIFSHPDLHCFHVIIVMSTGIPPYGLPVERDGYVRGIQEIPPSLVSQPKAFFEIQEKSTQALHCHRGKDSIVTPPIPLTLLHPVFGQFIHDSQTLATTDLDNTFASQFTHTMKLNYWHEDILNGQVGRAPAVRNAFEEGGIHFVCTAIEVANSKKRYTDGDLMEAGCRYAILEVENEVGSGKADPYVQASFYYQEAFKEKCRTTSSVLPCLLILVFGPYIAFAGAAWNVRPTIEILSVIPLFHDTKYPANAVIKESVSRHLLAMKKALETLSDYYKKTLPPASPEQAFPFPRSYSFEDGISQPFEYQLRMDANRLIFFGKHPGASYNHLCIKFVPSYSIEAHRFWASKGRAPEILGYLNFPHDWTMVVMETVNPEYLPLDMIDFSASLVDNIRQTIRELHEQGFVHGDLRDINIMARKESAGQFVTVDWDWSGKKGEVRYPPNVNQEVDRPAGARDGELILPEHDLAMLDLMEKAYSSRLSNKRPLSPVHEDSELPHKMQRGWMDEA